MKTYKEFSISLQELTDKETFISRKTSDMTRKNIEDQKRIENRKRETKPLGDDLRTSKPSVLRNQEVESDSDPVSRSVNTKDNNVDNNYQGKDVKKQHQRDQKVAVKEEDDWQDVIRRKLKDREEKNKARTLEQDDLMSANEKQKYYQQQREAERKRQTGQKVFPRDERSRVTNDEKAALLRKEENEANAENCSNLPADEKKKERQMDIEKINKKIKPHHKKISVKK